MALNSLGRTYIDLGDQANAEKAFSRAWNLVSLTGDRKEKASTLDSLCRASLEAGHPANAKQHCNKALALYREAGDQEGFVITLVNLGRADYLLGQIEQARSTLSTSIKLARDLANEQLQSAAFYWYSRVWLDRGSLDEAARHARMAVEIMESTRVPAQPGSGSFSLSREDVYDLYIDILMRLQDRQPGDNYAALALEAKERSKARSLIEALAWKSRDINREDPSYAADRYGLISQLNQQTRILFGLDQTPENSDRRAVATGEVRELLAQLRNIDTIHRSPLLPIDQSLFPTLRQIQGQLDEGTLLLEFHLGSDRSFLWAVSRDDMETFNLPEKESIESHVMSAYRNLYQNQLSRRRAQEYLNALSKMLLGPAEPLLGRRPTLVIVPDGALAYLPFAALPYPSGTAATSDPQPLALSHSAVELPSMSSLLLLRQPERKRDASKSIAVFADPIVSSSDPRIVSPSPNHADKKLGLKSFTRLPYSAQEATYILKLVPPSHALQAVGSDANREVLFSSRIARYDILHFATHVSINREDPELNSLVFSLFDLQGRPRDGWIRAYELPSLTLSADLVVLSGCDTAIGSEEQGEGLRSLSRQFLEIGVPRVVASRFRVDDRATAEFMASFYTNLLRGDRPPSQALRLAQVEMARSEEWKDSFQWAAFSLTGDWR